MRSLVLIMTTVALTVSSKANADDRAQPVAGKPAVTPARDVGEARDAAEPRSEPRPVAATNPADSAPGGSSPCIGKWKTERVKWGRDGCDPATRAIAPNASSFLVTRGATGYEARRMEGPQDLIVTTRTDTTDRCLITVTDGWSDRFSSFQLVFSLDITKGGIVASGTYSETDEHLDPPSGCRSTFTAKATREPLSAVDVEFDPAVAAREFARLWAGEDKALTLKQFCEDLPVMKTRLPRKAKVTVGVTATAEINKLVIDGVDQGQLDSGCHFPLALDLGEPRVLTNRSGVAQTFTADIELR